MLYLTLSNTESLQKRVGLWLWRCGEVWRHALAVHFGSNFHYFQNYLSCPILNWMVISPIQRDIYANALWAWSNTSIAPPDVLKQPVFRHTLSKDYEIQHTYVVCIGGIIQTPQGIPCASSNIEALKQ